MKLQHVLTFVAVILAPISLRATMVIPPTFEQLVNQSEFIFQGTVTEVRSFWEGEGAQRHIDTYVTFQVNENLKGNAGNSYTIRLLGGTVGGETMEVSDTPKFREGDREILFVEHNLQQFVPLVGINHGRFHLQRDSQSGRDVMLNGEGEPLRDVTKLGHAEESIAAADAISPDDFKASIRRQLQVAQ
jgi:hypothetical protein